MGANRHQQKGLDIGPDHRPARRERIGGRAGRGGEHHAVAPPARQRPPVDLGDQVDHPLPGRLFHRRLVQRPGGGDDRAVLPDRDVDRHPALDQVAPGQHVIDGIGEVVGLGLGQEADVAEVHPEQRRADRPGQLGGAEQSPVAADHQHHLGLVRRLRRGRHRRSRPGSPGRRPRTRAPARPLRPHPAAQPPGAQSLTPAGRPVCTTSSIVLARPASPRSALIADHSRSPAADRRALSGGAARASHKKYSTLPDGPGNGLAVTPAHPEAQVGRGLRHGLRRRRPAAADPALLPRNPPGPCRPRTAA